MVGLQPAQYVLLALRTWPYFQSKMGAGIPMAMEMRASRLFAHPQSSLAYIAGPKRGKLKPARVRTKAAAPLADAAYRV